MSGSSPATPILKPHSPPFPQYSRSLRICREAFSTRGVRPDLLADQTIDPRLAVLRGGRHDPYRRLTAGHFHQQLGADRFLELVAVLDRDNKGAGAADHAVLVV